jgi:hypothetical protein
MCSASCTSSLPRSNLWNSGFIVDVFEALRNIQDGDLARRFQWLSGSHSDKAGCDFSRRQLAQQFKHAQGSIDHLIRDMRTKQFPDSQK